MKARMKHHISQLISLLTRELEMCWRATMDRDSMIDGAVRVTANDIAAEVIAIKNGLKDFREPSSYQRKRSKIILEFDLNLV
jgi:hypothetical protein